MQIIGPAWEKVLIYVSNWKLTLKYRNQEFKNKCCDLRAGPPHHHSGPILPFLKTSTEVRASTDSSAWLQSRTGHCWIDPLLPTWRRISLHPRLGPLSKGWPSCTSWPEWGQTLRRRPQLEEKGSRPSFQHPWKTPALPGCSQGGEKFRYENMRTQAFVWPAYAPEAHPCWGSQPQFPHSSSGPSMVFCRSLQPHLLGSWHLVFCPPLWCRWGRAGLD